jgi:formate/nitrite transporter FocA (FNT family)
MMWLRIVARAPSGAVGLGLRKKKKGNTFKEWFSLSMFCNIMIDNLFLIPSVQIT